MPPPGLHLEMQGKKEARMQGWTIRELQMPRQTARSPSSSYTATPSYAALPWASWYPRHLCSSSSWAPQSPVSTPNDSSSYQGEATQSPLHYSLWMTCYRWSPHPPVGCSLRSAACTFARLSTLCLVREGFAKKPLHSDHSKGVYRG